MRVRFGEYVLDTDTRELLGIDTRVHLSPKAFDLLSLLVENRPRALVKAELIERLWPGTFVSEANLPNLIAEIRNALADDPHSPRFVRTVHRYGYAFSGEAVDDATVKRASRAAGASCWLIGDFGEIALKDGENVLGRDEAADIIRVDSPTVSRRHARIFIEGNTATLEDLQSKNSTYVGKERVVTAVRLADGDEILVGSIRLKFRIVSPASSTETVGRTS